MSFDELFAPGMRYLQEQKDFEEDDSHHLTAEGNPFDDMLDAGAVTIEGVKPTPPGGEDQGG
ncbi:MAG: hypothetical protein GX593_11100 [Actinomycetales bacterium]|nr:hypothetical protein [Actinomycetales bacterium]